MTDPFTDLAATLDYPMFVVTAASGGERSGCLVGFATQCSIDPARFLVCVSRKNHTCRVAEGSDVLAVHVLGAGQRDVAELFGTQTGDEIDKFARCGWSEGPAGVPLLDACPGRFVGRVLDRFDLGDHIGHLLEVDEAEGGNGGPLLTFQAVRDMDPGHGA